MKVLAWCSLSSFVLGLLIAASPYFLILIIGEESGDGAALGWIFHFFALPVGLLLTVIAITLILIVGIFGLVNGSSLLFGILAIAGACAVCRQRRLTHCRLIGSYSAATGESISCPVTSLIVDSSPVTGVMTIRTGALATSMICLILT